MILLHLCLYYFLFILLLLLTVPLPPLFLLLPLCFLLLTSEVVDRTSTSCMGGPRVKSWPVGWVL